jgi:serine protease
MKRSTLLLLLAGLLLGGGVALYLHFQYPKPEQREDGSWGLPHNPFAKAEKADWQHVAITLTAGDESDSTTGRWFIDDVKDGHAHRHLEVDGETFEMGAYPQGGIPSIDDFVGLEPGLISDVTFERTTLDVGSRKLPCTYVNFMVYGQGIWAEEWLWLCKDVKGSGIARWAVNVGDIFTVDFKVKGYGTKDGATWGEPYDPSHAHAATGPRYGEELGRLRAMIARKIFQGLTAAPVPHHTADEVLVDLRDGTTTEQLRDFSKRHKVALRWESQDPSARSAAIAIAHVAPENEGALLAELRKDPLVECAEHNDTVTVPDEDVFTESTTSSVGARDAIPEEDADKPREGFPNDSLFDKQWHLRMIHAPEAWKLSTGKGVIVGVIDTGVCYTKKKGVLLPDLAGTQFVEGYDFVNDDRIAADDQGHGSHVSGTIAQTTDNGRGCAGVAPGATVMPIKVLDSNGSGTAADVAAGIRFAADHGCKVLNLSLGGGGRSQAMANAVKYAFDKGCVVCCAAGNSGRRRVEYPAAYDGALAVSSVGPSGKRAFYSSYGKEVFVAAPGGDKSNSPEDGVLQNAADFAARKSFYGFWQGTSMATPHVAGAAALVVGRGVTNPAQVMEILKNTATKGGKTGQGRDDEYGYGVIDAKAAVEAAGAPDRVALVAALALLVFTFWAMRQRTSELDRGLLAVGALVGSCGLSFFGVFPSVGLLHAFPEWGQGNPLFASAAIPFFIGLVSVPSRGLRSLALGLMLGSAAHLMSMAWFDYTTIAWVPFERLWLLGNGVFLLLGTGMVVRLAKGRGVA